MCFDPNGKFAPFGICPGRPGHCFLAEAAWTLSIHASQAIMFNCLLLFLIGTAIQLTPSGSHPAKTGQGGAREDNV